MSMTGIILAAVVVGGTGLFIGVFLGIAGKKFAVKVDEREEAILGVLPGNNCGGCGYAGCSGLAAAIVKGEAEVSASELLDNAYIYAYRRDLLERHMKEAEKGIRFVTTDGKEKFRVSDGEQIRIITGGDGTRDRTARYIDAGHMELSLFCFS